MGSGMNGRTLLAAGPIAVQAESRPDGVFIVLHKYLRMRRVSFHHGFESVDGVQIATRSSQDSTTIGWLKPPWIPDLKQANISMASGVAVGYHKTFGQPSG
jgi:hypothetical protein